MNKKPIFNLRIRHWLESLPLSLRAKLISGNLLIVFIALASMGYYVYFRAQEANTYLSSELDKNVRQKAEAQLLSLSGEHATELNHFFNSISTEIAKLGTTTHNLLSQESMLGGGAYWDSVQSLFRLTNQSWDNANTEIASVFIPASLELNESLISELNTLKQMELYIPPALAANPDIIAFYFGGVSKETIYFPNIDLAGLVPPDFDVTTRPWYVIASPERNPMSRVAWSAPYLDAALHGLVVTSSVPVYDSVGSFRGVAAMDIQLNHLADLVSKIRIGNTGYAFIADRDNRLIAMPQAAYNDFGTTEENLPLGEVIDRTKLVNVPPEFFEILTRVSSAEDGLTTLTLQNEERYIVYQSIPEVRYGLVLIVPTREMLAEAIIAREQVTQVTRNAILVSIILVAGLLIASSLAAFAMGNALTDPLSHLTRTAEEITAGNLNASAFIQSRDEIGALSRSFDGMTLKLRDMISFLEQRIAERTADLESARQQSEKRAQNLQTVGEISSVITGEQKIENLLPLITRLVSEKFNFDHVGIFLVDETGRYAVLQASNSEGGRRMLARGHKLEVGVIGIVGFVAKSGLPRIALDVGDDAVFFNNPDLPRTRSEIALPLNARGQTIGVLDVQSQIQGAFTEDDINNLNILADQIASVIENARLFGQTQQTYAELQSLYGQFMRQGWQTFQDEGTVIGYHQELVSGKKLQTPLDTDEIRLAKQQGKLVHQNPESSGEPASLVVPVKLRGQVIGVISIKAPSSDRAWSPDELALSEAVSDRLALALENARLIQDSQVRAAKEQAIGEITTKIGASINMRNVIQTAVEELGRALPGSEVEIDFKSNGQSADDN